MTAGGQRSAASGGMTMALMMTIIADAAKATSQMLKLLSRQIFRWPKFQMAVNFPAKSKLMMEFPAKYTK